MSNKPSATHSFSAILLGIPAFAVPLFLLDATIDPALTPRFALLSVALLFVVVFGYKDFQAATANGQLGFLIRTILLPFMVYLLCTILSLTRAVNVSEGIFEVLKTLLFLIFLLVATFIIRTQRASLAVLTKGVSLLAIVVSVIGISQHYHLGFEWIPGPADAQPFSTFANKNLFSSFLFLTLPFVLFGFFTFNARWHITAGISFTLALYAILVAQTRAVWVALVLSFALIVVAAVLYFYQKKLRFSIESLRIHELRILQFCALVVAVIALNFLQPLLFRSSTTSDISTVEKAASIFDPQNSSRNERITLWKKSLLIIKDYPLLGVGAGNWKIVFPKYGLVGTRMEMGTVHFPQPHNDFLWVASETGIIGLAAYVAIFLLAIYYCAKIVTTSDNLHDQILSLAMAFGIIGYMTISFFDFPKERIEHLVYVALILSTILAMYDKLFPLQMKLPGRVVRGLCGIIVFLLVFSTVVGLIRMHAEMHTRRALAARQASEWDGVIQEIDEAYSYYAALDPMVTPLPWYRGVAYFSKNNTVEALKDFTEAYAIHPHHIHVLNNLGSCYERLGDHSKAIEFYIKALAISPRFEESLLNLTAVYFNVGKYEEAYQTILQCSDSKDPRAMMFLAAVKGKLNIR
jgi:O-antigen ligase